LIFLPNNVRQFLTTEKRGDRQCSQDSLKRLLRGQTHGSRVLLGPSDLPGDTQTFGDDMYLYEGNAKTYLYVEQDGGKRLVVLDVTNPNKIRDLATISTPDAEPYDFVEPYGDGSVLVRYRRKVDGRSIWGRVRVNTPCRSPAFETWRQDCGVIVDPLNSQAVNVSSFSPQDHRSTGSFEVMDGSTSEPRLLGAIPGVQKVLTDSERGHTFFLARNGVWILRDLSVEREYERRIAGSNLSH
jgi:hypothetical protein